MNESVPILEDGTGFDRLLGFTLPDRHARGRVVRLGPVLDEILSAHAYPPAIKGLLAEALVLTALLGGLLKDEGSQLTMQVQAPRGIVSLLVCDYREGEVRGYAQFDAERLGRLGSNPSLGALFGTGHLAITFDIAGEGKRYQGIVPLEGASLAEACEGYFAQSEQVPTLIRVGVHTDAGYCVAGGLLVQHLADGEEGRERLHVRMDHPEWEHVAVLAGSTRHDELTDPILSLEEIVWRLFHEEREIRVEKGAALRRGCRCTIEHYRKVLARFPEDERVAMRDENGLIVVDCAFCSRLFEIDL
ncbi:MAG: Hsp33 family molecular chaperone HslO [Candidatus Andeanibacterium colombiense]|uniref:Hsp33 family molecular chaperone HslO n=1 Tax=Candidatus Andeanibacterium colombiense TaxID=3121345 RepID=A0AAJ5X6S6_9SPHN|nr:MAG: Hsp33 family molecular chaperone HslO [Sphingomonadaceae bacterium]